MLRIILGVFLGLWCLWNWKAEAAVLIGLEAEQANEINPLMEIQKDPEASGGKFILTPGNNDPRNQGWTRYKLDIPKTEKYVVWGRTLSPSGGQNSFYITFDMDNIPKDGLFTWGTPEGPKWIWNLANWTNTPNSPPQIFELKQGFHELRIWAREAGTQMDGMYITDDQKLTERDLPFPIKVTPRAAVSPLQKLVDLWGKIKSRL